MINTAYRELIRNRGLKIINMRNSIEHVVLLKIRDDALRTQIEEMMIAVKSLTKISGVLQVSTGGGLSSDDNESCTFLDSSSCHGFNHVLCVHLESKEALRVYQDHEYHIKIRDDFIKPLLSGKDFSKDELIQKRRNF